MATSGMLFADAVKIEISGIFVDNPSAFPHPPPSDFNLQPFTMTLFLDTGAPDLNPSGNVFYPLDSAVSTLKIGGTTYTAAAGIFAISSLFDGISPFPPFDFLLTGVFDVKGFDFVFEFLFDGSAYGADPAPADLDFSTGFLGGKTNWADAGGSIFEAHFIPDAGYSATTTVVTPEPGSLFLLFGGLAGVFGFSNFVRVKNH